MTNEEKLKIYNTVREMQKKVQALSEDKRLSDWERMALDTLDGCLYITGDVFAKQQ